MGFSRLELLGVQLEPASSALARLDSPVREQRAIGELEDAKRSLLGVKEWMRETPQRATVQEGREND
jgi:hypothetical protein